MSDELVRIGEVHYSRPMARALLRDVRLSFGARGLFAFLWDLPKGWKPNLAHLVTMNPKGREAVLSLIRELERVGAIRMESIKTHDGTFAGRRWVLYTPEQWANEAPLKSQQSNVETEDRVSRSSGFPNHGLAAAKVQQAQGTATQDSAKEAASSLRQAGDFAASGGSPQKRRRRRSTGIVTWTADDESEAQRIELAYSSELVAAGIESAKKDGRQPLPGIVEESIQRLIEAKAGSGRQTELRARIIQDMQDRIEASADIVANGEKLLSSVRSGGRAHADTHE